ncbi:MAG: DUF6178 family protein [Syntrophobacteraceae bacterium]
MPKTIVDFEEKRMQKLPPRELSRLLMNFPAKKRLEVILERPDAEDVVAAIADQDFYFTVKEIGPDDALPLLSLARVDQLNHLFDIEWWRKDEPAASSALDWLARLARASEEKLLSWLYDADFDLLTSLFKKWIRVDIAPEDMDLVEAMEQLPIHTLDDQYFWETRYPQYEEFIKGILSILFELNYAFYRELMNHILYAVDIEVEENAYRFHRARLEDRAIPDFYDSLEIYRAVRPDETVSRKHLLFKDAEAAAAPGFALALLPEKEFLSRALREVQDPLLMDTLQIELASLSNKVVTADQLPPDNPQALRDAVDKAAAYVSLGLQLASLGRFATAVDILKDTFLEHLFRIAHAEVMILRNRLQKELQSSWLSRWPAVLNILDPPWMEAAELLIGKTPRILRHASGPDNTPKEDIFRSREDLIQGKHTIDVIASLKPVFDTLHPEPERLRAGLWEEAQIAAIEDVTLGALIWTAAARYRIESDWRVEPIPVKSWPAVFPAVAPEAIEEVVRLRVSEIVSDPAQHMLVETYLLPLFQAYAEEMAPFKDGRIPDPQMMKFFLFT